MTQSNATARTGAELLGDLEARGLLHQTTHREALERHLDEPRVVYAGFDPTKDSLTIGNLVAIALLRRFQLAGHRPVVVMGGGTGLIGDPSGKDSERQLLSKEQIDLNIAGQKPIFEKMLEVAGQSGALVCNNADWIQKLSYVDVLRDVGKHFSVNMMMQKDSVRTRLTEREHGISYTEFSYMILQAYDFAHLAESQDVTVQLGGSDQWGNIVAGVDLARRLHGREVFGLTAPLVVKSDGGKFGKTESGAIWLTSAYTSPYAFYQFWMNTADADVERYLKIFSFRPLADIERLTGDHQKDPAARVAQRALAEELTELLHGAQGLRDAMAATQALFSGSIKELPPALLDEVMEGAPQVELSRAQLEEGVLLVDLLVVAGVAKSKREARGFISSGAVALNGDRIEQERTVGAPDLLHQRVLVIRRGKKTWSVVRVVD